MKKVLLGYSCMIACLAACNDGKFASQGSDQKVKEDVTAQAEAQAEAPVAPEEVPQSTPPMEPTSDQVEEVAIGNEIPPEEGLPSAEEMTNEMVEMPSGETAVVDQDAAFCQASLGSDAVVVRVDENGQVNLVDGAIVFLEVSGSRSVELDSDDIAKLRGICLFMTGGSTLTMDVDIPVEALFYYGRGAATAALNFDDEGTLKSIVADVAGENTLYVDGDNILCNEFTTDIKGASQLICNGTPQ